MKKKSKIALFLAAIFAFSICFAGCSKNGGSNSELKTVRLNEVVRSIFYAPKYISINEGFFEEEGLNIDLSTGQGADKVMQNDLQPRKRRLPCSFCRSY